MQRTNIYLTDEEHRLLKERARQEGTTMAQVVRDIIDHDLGLASDKPTMTEALGMTSGMWSDRSDEELDELRSFRGLVRFERSAS